MSCIAPLASLHSVLKVLMVNCGGATCFIWNHRTQLCSQCSTGQVGYNDLHETRWCATVHKSMQALPQCDWHQIGKQQPDQRVKAKLASIMVMSEFWTRVPQWIWGDGPQVSVYDQALDKYECITWRLIALFLVTAESSANPSIFHPPRCQIWPASRN